MSLRLFAISGTNCHGDICPGNICPKLNNKNNAILMGFDTIEINLENADENSGA